MSVEKSGYCYPYKMGRIFNNTIDQVSNAADEGDHFIHMLEGCSTGYNRKTDKPCCHVAVGIIQEVFKWLSGGREFCVETVSCHACGDDMGHLRISKELLNVL